MLTLQEIYTFSVPDEKKAVERIATTTDLVQFQSDIGMLWYYNQTFALHAFFIENDIARCKQHFFRCGKLDEYLIKKYGERILDYGINHIGYVLLSDASLLIHDYAALGHPHYEWMVTHGHSTLTYVIQQASIGNWDRVKWGLNIMATKNIKQNNVLQPDRDFFQALLERNRAGMENALGQLLKNHKRRNKHAGIAREYISIPAIGYAKLAWMQGIEVSVDHPLIPKELLPVAPLQDYDAGYDFLKE